MSEVLMMLGRVEKLVNERRASELERRGWQRVGPKAKKKKKEQEVKVVEEHPEPIAPEEQQSDEELKHE